MILILCRVELLRSEQTSLLVYECVMFPVWYKRGKEEESSNAARGRGTPSRSIILETAIEGIYCISISSRRFLFFFSFFCFCCCCCARFFAVSASECYSSSSSESSSLLDSSSLLWNTPENFTIALPIAPIHSSFCFSVSAYIKKTFSPVATSKQCLWRGVRACGGRGVGERIVRSARLWMMCTMRKGTMTEN
jgi:hypothetical protein